MDNGRSFIYPLHAIEESPFDSQTTRVEQYILNDSSKRVRGEKANLIIVDEVCKQGNINELKLPKAIKDNKD